MNIWRMKLRAGHRGYDMFPTCKIRHIASYTHKPIYNTDLTYLDKGDVDPAVKGPARSSIWLFAWEIKGGDEIYVGDSKTHSIIAKGIVAGKLGKRAYRYNAGEAMKAPSGVAWRHEVPVQWERISPPISYRDPAPRHSVYKFKPLKDDKRNGRQQALMGDEEEIDKALLNELAVLRESVASKKKIKRQHASLSNQFRLWLERRFGMKVRQEKNRIDLTFTHLLRRHLAELKICYASDTRHAIREALGQLFEYNHYPSYEEAHFWWIVLDCEPSETDRRYVTALIEKYNIPLTVAWLNGGDFEAFPSFPLKTPRRLAKPRSG